MVRPEALAVTILLTMLAALGPISTDLYLPALPTLQAYFEADVATVQLTLSVYLAAFAACQILYGPLSDKYGRRPVLMLGTAIYFGGSAVCMLSGTIEMLIAGRFLQALGGCAGVVLSRTVIRDVYGVRRSAKLMSYMGTAMALAPALGPIIGGFLTVAFGWESNFIILTVYGGLCMLGVTFLLQETNQHKDPKAANPLQILRNFRALIGHRAYAGYLLSCTFSYSGLFAFISGSSFVFIQVFGLSADQYGFCFAAAVVGYMTGTQIGGRLVTSHGIKAMVFWGAGVNALAGVLMLGLATGGIHHFLAVLAPMMLYMVGMGLVLPNALAGAIGPFPKMAGAASSLTGSCQYGVAAVVGLAVGHGFNSTQMPMATAICVMGIGALLAYLMLIHGTADPAENAAD